MTIIAGGGFARMAWELALFRAGLETSFATSYHPMRMTDPCNDNSCEHCSYFRIIDSAEYAMAHAGIHGYGPVIRL